MRPAICILDAVYLREEKKEKVKELHDWFAKEKRDFPWRQDVTPYRVWISEVMLQQTRAQVVVSYFERWMLLFPDVRALARAPLDEVIKAWEGLGYYSRARNIHLAAKQIVQDFEGNIPSNKEQLAKLAGLGLYTVSAILSFGFHQKTVPVDGNVLRVCSRFFLIEEDVGKANVKTRIQKLAETLLDEESPWITAEALIELGASVCTPRPSCEECPIQSGCKAALHKKAGLLPIKKENRPIQRIFRSVAVVETKQALLVKKNGPGRVMADLCEFPYFEGKLSYRMVQMALEKLLGREAQSIGKLCATTHTFTNYRAALTSFRFRLDEKSAVDGYFWIPLEELDRYSFSSGHRRILREWQMRAL